MNEKKIFYRQKKNKIKIKRQRDNVCLQDTKLAKINKINNTLQSAQVQCNARLKQTDRQT